MGCCSEKQPCTGKTVYDVCVKYQSDLLNWNLKELNQDCVNMQEVTEDIIDYINISFDNSELGNNCLKYEKDRYGRILQSNINLKFEEEICNLQNSSDNDYSNNFKFCNLDYGFLIDDCDKPKNECDFFQLILNTLKELKNA